jgi:molybdopterin-guanine dinucleotide biosynthesis protein A
MSSIVLAGGRGSRLDYDKAFAVVGNQSLLERAVRAISSFKRDIIIVTAAGKPLPQLKSYPKLKIAQDIYPGKGALGGLYTGLVISDAFYNFVVASDMPFLNRALLAYMTQLASGYDAVIPRLGSMIEPLHAVYSKSCLEPLERLLKQGNLKISDVLPLIRARYVEAQEIERFDPKHLSLFNVNTEADLAKARELAKENTGDGR